MHQPKCGHALCCDHAPADQARACWLPAGGAVRQANPDANHPRHESAAAAGDTQSGRADRRTKCQMKQAEALRLSSNGWTISIVTCNPKSWQFIACCQINLIPLLPCECDIGRLANVF